MSQKTLLGIIASPRKLGNCEIFIKELHSHLPGEWKLRLIRLTELDIRSCNGCYRCLMGEMRCHIADDFNLALDAIKSADAFVVAAPAYVLGANASLKRFQDRGLGYYGAIDHLWRKPAVGLVTAGIRGMEGHTKLGVDSFIKSLKLDHRGSTILYGALPGEIFVEDNGKEVAAQMARQLLGEVAPPEPAAPHCTACGGDTFRFLPEGGVRCMVCSSAGTVEIDGGALRIETKASNHQFFLTYENAKNHGAWLKEKKEYFLSKRDQVKEITSPYAGIGEWVRPERLLAEEGK